MSAFSDFLENELMDHMFRNSVYSKPALHFALFTAAPSDSGGGTEVTGGSYARATVTNDNTAFPQCAATGTPTKTNALAITFPTASAAWGTVTHWGIFDASTSGNLLAHGALASTRTIASGDVPRLAVGAISLTMSNAVSGGLTDFAKRKLLDHVFGGPAYTPIATLYTGLGTALSGETITEWADTAYTRQATAFDAASGGACINADAETYTDGGGADDVATLTHFGVWDDSGAGNLLAVGPLGASRSIVATDAVTLPDGSLSISLQ
jgi:phosphatidylethanolamine-binding protein (PEBP) family uncharacterized protein